MLIPEELKIAFFFELAFQRALVFKLKQTFFFEVWPCRPPCTLQPATPPRGRPPVAAVFVFLARILFSSWPQRGSKSGSATGQADARYETAHHAPSSVCFQSSPCTPNQQKFTMPAFFEVPHECLHKVHMCSHDPAACLH